MDRKIDEVIDVLAANDHHVSSPSGVPGAAAHAGAQTAGDVVFTAADSRKKATGSVVVATAHAGKVAGGIAATPANARVTTASQVFCAPTDAGEIAAGDVARAPGDSG